MEVLCPLCIGLRWREAALSFSGRTVPAAQAAHQGWVLREAWGEQRHIYTSVFPRHCFGCTWGKTPSKGNYQSFLFFPLGAASFHLPSVPLLSLGCSSQSLLCRAVR